MSGCTAACQAGSVGWWCHQRAACLWHQVCFPAPRASCGLGFQPKVLQAGSTPQRAWTNRPGLERAASPSVYLTAGGSASLCSLGVLRLQVLRRQEQGPSQNGPHDAEAHDCRGGHLLAGQLQWQSEVHISSCTMPQRAAKHRLGPVPAAVSHPGTRCSDSLAKGSGAKLDLCASRSTFAAFSPHACSCCMAPKPPRPSGPTPHLLGPLPGKPTLRATLPAWRASPC